MRLANDGVQFAEHGRRKTNGCNILEPPGLAAGAAGAVKRRKRKWQDFRQFLVIQLSREGGNMKITSFEEAERNAFALCNDCDLCRNCAGKLKDALEARIKKGETDAAV